MAVSAAADSSESFTDGRSPKFDPRLVDFLKRCISVVWRTAAELVNRILELPPLLSLPPPSAGSSPPAAPHISHAATVTCEVLRHPNIHKFDVIFVHGLYGSLANTWRQGDWRRKHKTELNKIPLRRHSTEENDCNCTRETNQSEANNNTNRTNFTFDSNDRTHQTIYNDEDETAYEQKEENLEGYLLSSVEIMENYRDIMSDMLTNEYDLYTEEFSEDTKINCDEYCDKNDALESRINNDMINKLNDDNFAVEHCNKNKSNIENEAVSHDSRYDSNKNKDDNTKTKKDTKKKECLCDSNEALDNESESNERRCEVGCGCTCSTCYSDCWPRDWLAVDYPNARVISINYTSDPHLWRPVWFKEHKRLRLQERAEQMMEQLLKLQVGTKPIVWVGHSKGGLFIKQIYVEGHEEYQKDRSSLKGRLWRKSRGFMFYSVPHRGSPLADINIPPIIARSIELLEMGKDCAEVLALQERWLVAVRRCPPAVRSLVETRRTLMAVLWLTIVSFQSADAGIGALFGVAVDHREICKPSSRSCSLYRELVQVVESALTRNHGEDQI